MYFILIPFFLAAQVPVDQTDIWAYGPEFSFAGKIAFLVSPDLIEDPFDNTNVTTTLKCRPKSAEVLLCRLENTTLEEYEDTPPKPIDIDVPFELKFNERGIESLSFEEPLDIVKLNCIRTLVSQLSVGADLNQYTRPTFIARENFILGECATLFTVLKFEGSRDSEEDMPESDRYFGLSILSGERPQRGALIQKRTDYRRCTKTDESFYNQDDRKIKIGASSTRILVHDTFKAQTQINMKMSVMDRHSIVRNIISLKLKSIEPAKERLPDGSFTESVGLLFSDTMQHNFII